MNKIRFEKEKGIINFLKGIDCCDDYKTDRDDQICQYCHKLIDKGSNTRFIHGHEGYPTGHVMYLIHEECYWKAINKYNENKENNK